MKPNDLCGNCGHRRQYHKQGDYGACLICSTHPSGKVCGVFWPPPKHPEHTDPEREDAA